jgi:hypothetical protein
MVKLTKKGHFVSFQERVVSFYRRIEDWQLPFLPIETIMPQEEKSSSKRTVLKSVFSAGSIKSMKDLEELYPTYIATLLGMNYSRYIEKLNKPERFTIKQIILLAELIDINPQVILTIILNQVATNKKKKPPHK